MSTSVVAELVTNLNSGMVVAVVFVAGLCAVAIRSWRAGVFLLLGYVTIEGLVSAMLYPSTLPLLSKDALLIAVYLGATRTVVAHWRDGTVFPRSVCFPSLRSSRCRYWSWQTRTATEYWLASWGCASPFGACSSSSSERFSRPSDPTRSVDCRTSRS